MDLKPKSRGAEFLPNRRQFFTIHAILCPSRATSTITMPPRLFTSLRVSQYIIRPASEISPFLAPFLYTQQRGAHILASLADNPGAFHTRIRRGRGPSSGKGKTSGRGHNGQKQHGKVPRGFNGGQTPDEVVHGKRGDHNFST